MKENYVCTLCLSVSPIGLLRDLHHKCEQYAALSQAHDELAELDYDERQEWVWQQESKTLHEHVSPVLPFIYTDTP